MSSGIGSISSTHVLSREISIQGYHYIEKKQNIFSIMMVRILIVVYTTMLKLTSAFQTLFFSEKGVYHSGSDYMEGCLDTIFIQGQKIDLDQAFFKDTSVSSHSCPV